MASQQKSSWKPGKRDLFFLGMVAAVVLALVLGTSERKTTPVPDDEAHRTSTSRAACMSCHGAEGVYPQSAKHTQVDKCFLCHTQPEKWVGAIK